MKTIELIHEFLSLTRFAMVGVSRDEKDFSRRLFHDLVKRGYDVVPVHPDARAFDGRPAVARVQDIRPPVRAALVMTSKELSEHIVLDCADAGIDLVWLYGISGERDAHPAAVEEGRKHGIGVIAGFCPYMFLNGVPFFHSLHKAVWRLLRILPR